MSTGDIPLLSMLRQRLGYLSDRQKVIAENVANADTPGYLARDVKPFRFDAHMASDGAGLRASSVQPSQTRSGHMAGKPMKPPPSPGRIVKAADSETTLDGNGVVLEDQMIKMTETRMQYDAAIGFYQKSMALLRLAARPPGR
jgi:flagellar basal-body rod protein FlgB